MSTVNQGKFLSLFTLGLVLLLALKGPSKACAPFYPEDHFGALADEVALIIWNNQDKREHFIRQARFENPSQSMGFVVPTPTKPEVAEIESGFFHHLDRISQPKTITKKTYWPELGFMFMLASPEKSFAVGDAAPIEVFQQGEVAGQEFVVLKASNPEALSDWLQKNKFHFPESHKTWAQFYIDKGYFFTAFKYHQKEKSQALQTGLVRISFDSESPYYPYKEPEVASPANRTRRLRLYLLSDARLRGETSAGLWDAKERFSAKIESLPKELQNISSQLHLTVFDDERGSRKGLSDLTFEPNPDQSELRPEPRIRNRTSNVTIPLDLIFILGVFFFLGRRFLKS